MAQTKPNVPLIHLPVQVHIALGELGVLEWTAPGLSNPQVEKYHGITRGGPAGDDVPWCSSWLCWVFEMAGYASPKSKRAADWLTWGFPCGPLMGCAAVFPKTDPDAGGSGHAALLLGLARKNLFVIGGNQGDAVTIATKKWTPEVRFRSPVAVAA